MATSREHRTGSARRTHSTVQALSRPAYGTDSPQVDGLCRRTLTCDMASNLRFHRRVQLRVVITMNGRPPGRTSLNRGAFARGETSSQPSARSRIYPTAAARSWKCKDAKYGVYRRRIVRCHNRLVNQIKKIWVYESTPLSKQTTYFGEAR